MSKWFLLGLLAVSLTACETDYEPPTPEPDMGEDDAGSDADDMSEDAPLDLRSISPSSGPAEGGTQVTLQGTGFANGVEVFFGDSVATNIQVESSTRIVLAAPAGEGVVDVRVVLGEETDTLQQAYSYNAELEYQITYCQLQAQSPVSVESGQESAGIYSVVFVDGLTNSAGQGSGIEGELGWGDTGADAAEFTWKAMTYNTDIDGLNAGDLANDEYGATLQIATAGTYDYLARYRVQGGDWVYCDLGGDLANPGARGVIEVTDPPVAEVGFCQTRPSSLTLENGASADVEGVVFVAGATNGAGAGANVSAEVVWGPIGDDPSAWTLSESATYSGDEDGLNQGDLANDVFAAQFVPAGVGEYGFAMRASADGGTTWTWCSNDGSEFDASKVGELEVVEELIVVPDSCKIQFPVIVTDAVVGEPLTIFGRVTKAGVTGQDNADVVGDLMVGPAGSSPLTNAAAFTVVNGTRRTTGVINPGPDEDEFEATWTPTNDGEYVFAWRFSVNQGQDNVLCDLSSDTNFEPTEMGVVRVWETLPDLVDYCNVWQASVSGSVGQAAPVLTIETYEAGVTDGTFDAADLVAEVGWGGLADNPALGYTWESMAYKGPRPGVPNNQEYESPIWAGTTSPAAGTYRAAARIRPAGVTNGWVYCDTSNASMDFLLESATSLDVH